MILHAHCQRPARVGAAIASFVVLLGFASQSCAGEAAGPKPLELRGIMQELGRNVQDITGAIAQDDWARVKEIAPRVATHPQPSAAEKVRILGYLGADAGRFRGYDEQTHAAAQAMEEAAARGDGKAVIQSFGRVLESCLGCHQEFRKRFVQQFYGMR